MCKFTDTIIKTINKGTIKSHSRCKGINVSVLKHRHVEVTTEERVINVRIGAFVESFELTSHWKSGSLYMHWIKLNKCLIKLSESIGDFHSWMFDFSNQNLMADTLGIRREGDYTEQEVRYNYRRLSWFFHPDNGGDPDLMRALTRCRDDMILFFEMDYIL